MKETELYPPVKRFLEAQGFAVKAEINGCDIVGQRDGEPPVIVEMKVGFTLQLVLQGIDRLALTDAVYLAVAEPRRGLRGDLIKLCRRVGVGLLSVRGRSVEVLADPVPYVPRRDGKRRARLLGEFARRVGDPNDGGSTRRPLMTAYRQDALRLARVLAAQGPCKVAALRTSTGVERAGAMLRDDVYGWFKRSARGIYHLTAKGHSALKEFAGALASL